MESPFGRRMVGHVEVKDSATSNFHSDQHVDQPECRRHNNKEVGGDDCFGVLTHESIQR